MGLLINVEQKETVHMKEDERIKHSGCLATSSLVCYDSSWGKTLSYAVNVGQEWPGTLSQVEPRLGNVICLPSTKSVGRHPSVEWLFAARENKSSSLLAATGRICSLATQQVQQKQTSACCFPRQKFRLQVWLLARRQRGRTAWSEPDVFCGGG